MYMPEQFTQDHLPTLHALIERHAFGTWTTWTGEDIAINHLPFLLYSSQGELGTLHTHFARENPLMEHIEHIEHSIVVFHGPQSYISPTWYPETQRHGRVVPTWDYAVVHARVSVHVIDDPQWILDHLHTIVDHFESNEPPPWHLDEAPKSYVEKLSKGVIGAEMTIEALKGKWKMSQNKPASTRSSIIDALTKSEDSRDHDTAALIAKTIDQDAT